MMSIFSLLSRRDITIICIGLNQCLAFFVIVSGHLHLDYIT
jgi:hypothetical protein